MTRISFPQRTITSQPKAGAVIDVEVPTHVIGVLEFADGAIATLVTSFDVWASQVPRIEIYGSTGTLSVPDPNTFGGPVLVRRAGEANWREVPVSHGFSDNSRGLGMADMADAIAHNRPHRASGALAYHVLDVMHTIYQAATSSQHITLDSMCEQPAPLATDQRF
jgi:predicted dehydrogenase